MATPSSSLQGQTPLLGQFLVALNGFITARNSTQLSSYLALEPPFNNHYANLITELRQTYPRAREEALETKCSSSLSAAREGADGSPWSPFIKFTLAYLIYLRDVDSDPSQYLRTYEMLGELQARGNSALQHPVLGALVLPVVVANARLVCRLAVGLDKSPELLARAREAGALGGAAAAGRRTGGAEEGGARETLPERAANILRNAFVTCLNDRSSGVDSKTGKPEGKKKGIYEIANLCLKILFQCRKTRNATQIFENIYNLSPPLDGYPKKDRVTFLYYLGRFFFQNSHFYRAQRVLQAAYDECPTRPDCVRQRRQILMYLLSANIILGRFPTENLLSRPEAEGLREKFLPLCAAIRRGDLAAFNQHLSLENSAIAPWFLRFRILLPLRNRCEVLVWRSLVRRTWCLVGTRPSPGTKIAPTVDLRDLVGAFAFLERRTSHSFSNQTTRGEEDVDPDFAGLPADDDNGSSPSGEKGILLRDALGIESVLSSLIDQGLLNGYLSHPRLKFAITGSKAKGGDALAAGFPNPWLAMKGRAEREGTGEEIPGWKKASASGGLGGTLGGIMGGGGGGGFGPGMVVNLSGLRPVGTAG